MKKVSINDYLMGLGYTPPGDETLLRGSSNRRSVLRFMKYLPSYLFEDCP